MSLVTIYPDFYENFACKAGLCQHSCCCGWEIDIDAETLKRYQALTGGLGDEIRQNIEKGDDSWQFRLRDNMCCPFLREDGLCQLIIRADENILCDICRNHPRFFVLAAGYELAGMGLSCERTCELLLAKSDMLLFHEGGRRDFWNLQQLLSRMGLELSTEDLVYMPGMTTEDATFVLDCMEKTEPIDGQWAKELQALQELVRSSLPSNYVEEKMLTRIYQYILYRSLGYMDKYGLATVISYAQLNTDFIVISSMIGQLSESIRRWSEQIEYNTQNSVLLMNMI